MLSKRRIIRPQIVARVRMIVAAEAVEEISAEAETMVDTMALDKLKTFVSNLTVTIRVIIRIANMNTVAWIAVRSIMDLSLAKTSQAENENVYDD